MLRLSINIYTLVKFATLIAVDVWTTDAIGVERAGLLTIDNIAETTLTWVGKADVAEMMDKYIVVVGHFNRVLYHDVRAEEYIVNAQSIRFVMLHVIANFVGSISFARTILAHEAMLLASIVRSLALIEVHASTFAFP